MKVIGIDPGRSTGFAVYSQAINELIRCETTDFWGCADRIETYRNDLFIVELPKTKHVWHKAKGQVRQTSIGVDVGGVIREAELIIELLKRLDCKYRTVHPQGKIDAEMFKRITGYTGRTNEHSRDAGMLAWGVKK